MRAKNIFHDTVIQSLIADGWTITDNPLSITYGGQNLYVDLGVEPSTLGAERTGQRIAVTIHDFLYPSSVRTLQNAVGQYKIYRVVLAEIEPDRQHYLAVPGQVYDTLFSNQFGQLIITRGQLQLLVFDEQQQKVIRWIG